MPKSISRNSKKAQPPADLFRDGHAAVPDATFAKLRATGRVHFDELTSCWYVVRFDDVWEGLADSRLVGRGVRPTESTDAAIRAAEEFFSSWMVFDESPSRDILRDALIKSFRGPARAQLTAEMRHSTRLITSAYSGGDLVSGYAEPLALSTLTAVLGLEPDETTPLTAIARSLTGFLAARDEKGPVADSTVDAIERLERFVLDTLLPRARGPVAPVLAELVNAQIITRASAVATVAQLLTGVLEPTTTVVAIAVWQVAHDSAIRDDVRAGRLAPDNVVEEALRWGSPFHIAPRRAAVDLQIAGTAIHAGDRVALALVSANHDSGRWAQPDRFDPFRLRRAHVALGRGGRSCVGAHIARVQTLLALETALASGLLDTPIAGQLERVGEFGLTRAQLR